MVLLLTICTPNVSTEKLCNSKRTQFLFADLVVQMMLFAKTVPEVALQLHDRLTKAGFVDIRVKTVAMKLNHTDKGGELFW